MAKVIEVKNLKKRYKKADKNAVDGISFSISEGEFFSFLGPNGAGKTTTISILTTTLAKTSGEVKIGGFDMDREPNKVRGHIGVIFQNPSLDLNLTAEENIRFHAVLYGLYTFRPAFSMMPDSYKKRVYELAEILTIEKDLFRPIKTFSGGMKRKLEIVRSLIHKPKVLFLDEPTSGLDPISRKSLWDYLQQVRKEQNTTIFLTTHYLDEAEGTDHVAIVNNGKIISYGTPEKIKQTLVENYLLIDSPDRNKLKKELQEKKIKFLENGQIKVPLTKFKAQEVIKKIDTELSVMQIHAPTLEEAYVEIIANSMEKDKS
ncbi:ABC transporter ATP-binding protein [Candidatus Roizmanbacteria bacterium RIFCSPLOWO2_12_FULL_40_12]|uniref:ABC transporter ATP-binding protein n=1 Tax=Candidatus Roizmanbacteria bacterium RIFCSPLOWO2_01_FULL_40_42 TaxID=1802066 RepID=A0A1F7J6L0_9BACT|nr:MAG: ABC transporter ATP-binding protein [Candidatus Roizmanbacteria bacterium RIFCSPHIGHO2_01_FULL_40_98]OGK29080.1 MAG: ABC transporter ATP-binding protein [Candidatus Roizmanbacteria bacterium RIFCSPHIGHO2_02_FULL_40_53]OGK29820.1 MAG: ABC transporter ATP-binding protein [Candidatus Roizmanbacteria bacterium RIFCSPHIGHO2_12_41_18]OGK36221.1 MAG: ABC transporter ATP-binding protein [Candidatus Roizmanbacteria bacterium RIFCSPHIGHO2_12_FULL_40_130]OGK51228.1 MAG: ABC transporter ATP-binding